MLDREDSTYFNLQGSMIYDPAINEDVPLVEGMLFCTAREMPTFAEVRQGH
jgi:hypothetical protein